MAVNIQNLRKWRNGEVFNARDYVYERDLIVQALRDLDIKVDAVDAQKLYYQSEEPEEQVKEGDIWFDI
jgi:hypothetical protein